MKASELRVAVVVPLMGYTLWSLASAAPAWSLAEVAAVGVSVGPLLSGVARRPTAWPNLPWLAVGVAILLSYWAGPPSWSSIGVPLVVGLVVASPIAVFGLVLVGRESMAIWTFLSTLTLAVAALDLAVVRQLHATGTGPFDAAAWSAAVSTTSQTQLASLGASALGAAPGSPLGNLGDGVLDSLGLLVVLGVLLALILPSARTPELRDEPRPVMSTLRWAPGASSNRPAAARAFASNARELPGTAYQMTGVASLIAALVAILLFQVASTDYAFPNVTATAIAVTIAVVALASVADRGAAARRREAARAFYERPAPARRPRPRLGVRPPPVPLSSR